MPIELNGQTVGDIELNGNTIGEVTVNGTTVYTSVKVTDLYGKYFTRNGNGVIEQFELGTANDFSSSVTQIDTLRGALGVTWKPDGTVFFGVDDVPDEIFSNPVTTPFRLDTAGAETSSGLSLDAGVRSVQFHPDGDRFWVGDNDVNIYEYSVSTPWDVSNVTKTDTYNIGRKGWSFDWMKNGDAFATVGNSFNEFAYWECSTPYDVATRNLVYTEPTPDPNPTDLDVSFDGTLLWIAGADNAFIYEATLSTPYDVSTHSSFTNTGVSNGQYGGFDVNGEAHYNDDL